MTDCIGWHYEDDLPADYPYDREFPRSRVVDGVRMFPPATAITPEGLERLGFWNQVDGLWVRDVFGSVITELYWTEAAGVLATAGDGDRSALPGIRTLEDVATMIRFLEGESEEAK